MCGAEVGAGGIRNRTPLANGHAHCASDRRAKSSADEQKKHQDFVARMVNKGYTGKQVRLLCEWYLRVRKSS